MNRLILVAACSLALLHHAPAAGAELLVEKVDNGGMVPGKTYRIWARLDNPSHTLHLVWGDEEHPLHITSTAPFFQHPLGSHSSNDMNQAVIDLQPALAFDSYVTVGYSRSAGNALWDLGVDFSDFSAGGGVHATNGAWFLLPTDAKCTPGTGGMVLIAQLTTAGEASGVLNLQGWVAPQQPWREYGLTFHTKDAVVFGCTDASAANYNPEAAVDNGTCEGVASPSVRPRPQVTALSSDWEVFPNPVRESLIHLRFDGPELTEEDQARIDIFDTSGKLMGTHRLSPAALTGGNRITLEQDLSNGAYQVVLVRGKTSDTRTIIVQR